jgi:hypothetical protein
MVNTKDAKAAREFIATLMDAVSLFIITMLKIPYQPAHFRVSLTEQNGTKVTSNASG